MRLAEVDMLFFLYKSIPIPQQLYVRLSYLMARLSCNSNAMLFSLLFLGLALPAWGNPVDVDGRGIQHAPAKLEARACAIASLPPEYRLFPYVYCSIYLHE